MIKKLFSTDTDSKSSDEKKIPPENFSQGKNPTKKDLARAVFKRMYGKPGIERKDIIAAFILDCDLTKAGASTYYADIKKNHGSSPK